MSSSDMIIANNISRIYDVPGGSFTALDDVSISIARGCFCILRGRSGSGKTTLMNILNTLDAPTKGEVLIDGKNILNLSERAKENLRRKDFGFVFQAVSLIPSLTAFQNVEFSLRMSGMRIGKDSNKRVEECLKMVGLGGRMSHMPSEMSGGEMQRVAVARAFAHRPKVIFADEPTAELDSAMASKVTQTFKKMAHDENITILMTTHDVGLMGAADMIIELENGVRING